MTGSASAAGITRTAARDLERRLGVKLGGEIQVGDPEPFGDGHSGFTYLLDLERDGAARRCVLRLSPPGVRLLGPADVGRQGRIMAALGEAGLPVPAILAWSSKPCVDGRAFVLMELVEGQSLPAALATTPPADLVREAIDVLGKVRALDPRRTGIGEEPAAGAAAELGRWAALLARTESGPHAEELIDALTRSRPAAAGPACLVHGDFHFGNLLFRDGSVVAILDWELAGLGSRFADLGCLAVASLRRRYLPDPNPTGFEFSLSDLLDLSGEADSEQASWWFAVACLKYAAILAYNRDLHRRGKRVDPLYEHFDRTIEGLLEDGRGLLAGDVDLIGERLTTTEPGA